MRRLTVVAICAVIFGLLATSPEAFSQQNASKNKRTDETTDTAARDTSSAYDWNGFYGGGNGGGGFGGANFLTAVPDGVPCFECEFYPIFPSPATPGIIAAFRSNRADAVAVSLGVQAGYNYMMGGVLLGVEVDGNYLNVSTSKTTYALGARPISPASYTFRNKIDANYIASLRPRIGFVVGGVLVYATGGVAMTTLNYEHDFSGIGNTCCANGPFGLGFNIFEHASASRVVAGWTVGGGTELPIGPIASLRLEYLFTQFASISTSENKIFPLPPGSPAPDFACGADVHPGFPRQCFRHKANLDLHTIRLGVNFKF